MERAKLRALDCEFCDLCKSRWCIKEETPSGCLRKCTPCGGGPRNCLPPPALSHDSMPPEIGRRAVPDGNNLSRMDTPTMPPGQSKSKFRSSTLPLSHNRQLQHSLFERSSYRRLTTSWIFRYSPEQVQINFVSNTRYTFILNLAWI